MVKTKRSSKSKNNKTRKTKKKEHAVIKEFRKMLNKNPIDRMYITTMIEQIPPGKKYDAHRLTNTEDLFRKLNNVLTVAPDFNNTLTLYNIKLRQIEAINLRNCLTKYLIKYED